LLFDFAVADELRWRKFADRDAHWFYGLLITSCLGDRHWTQRRYDLLLPGQCFKRSGHQLRISFEFHDRRHTECRHHGADGRDGIECNPARHRESKWRSQHDRWVLLLVVIIANELCRCLNGVGLAA
jgi:hypothetical protein